MTKDLVLLLLPSTVLVAVLQHVHAQSTATAASLPCFVDNGLYKCPADAYIITSDGQTLFLDAQLRCVYFMQDFTANSREGKCPCDVELYSDASPDDGGTFISDLRCKCFACPKDFRDGYAYSCEAPITGPCYAYDCSGSCVETQGFDPTVDDDDIAGSTSSQPTQSIFSSQIPSPLPSTSPSLSPTIVTKNDSPTVATNAPTVVQTTIAPTTDVLTILPTSLSPMTGIPSAIQSVSPVTTEPTTETVPPTELVLPTIVVSATPVMTVSPTTLEPVVTTSTNPPSSAPELITISTPSGQVQFIPVPTDVPPPTPSEGPDQSTTVPTTSQEMAPTSPGVETEPSMPSVTEEAWPTVIRPTFSEPLPPNRVVLSNQLSSTGSPVTTQSSDEKTIEGHNTAGFTTMDGTLIEAGSTEDSTILSSTNNDAKFNEDGNDDDNSLVASKGVYFQPLVGRRSFNDVGIQVQIIRVCILLPWYMMYW